MPRELLDVVVGLQLCGLLTLLSPISLIKLYKYYNYHSNYYYYYYYYYYYHYDFFLCAMADLIPLYLLRERVITHEKRTLRFRLLTLELTNTFLKILSVPRSVVFWGQ